MVKYFRSVTTHVPTDTQDKFKQKCKEKNVTMHEVLQNAILKFVEDPKLESGTNQKIESSDIREVGQPGKGKSGVEDDLNIDADDDSEPETGDSKT